MRTRWWLYLLLSLCLVSDAAQAQMLPPCPQRDSVVELPRSNINVACLEEVIQASEGLPFAFTALAAADDGRLYAARPLTGEILALTDGNGDGLPEQPETVLDGLQRPSALAYAEGALYIVDATRVLRLRADDLEIIIDDLPDRSALWSGGILVHAGRLIVGVGGACFYPNEACPVDESSGQVLSFDLNGGDRRVLARGFRQPQAIGVYDGDLWVGDGASPDTDVPFSDALYRVNTEQSSPAIRLATHSTPLSLFSYEGAAFPELQGQLLLLLGGARRTATIRGPEIIALTPLPGGNWQALTLVPHDAVTAPGDPVVFDPRVGYSNPPAARLNQRAAGFWPHHLYAMTVSPEGWLYVSVSDGRIMALRPR